MSTSECIDAFPLLEGLPQCLTGQYVAGSVEFRELLARIAARYPSKKALAKELGIDPSRLTRALNTGDFPLNVSNCLRLAKISGESPTEILRAAGKEDVADLIEALYGREAEFTVKEREILEAWRTLSPRAQGAIASLLDDLTPQKVKAKHKRPA